MLFETRYFLARFTTKDTEDLKKLRALLERSRARSASSVSIYEIYKLSLEQEGRDVAALRTSIIEKQFDIIGVDSEIAREGAKISSKLKVPMADALIMATAKKLQIACVTDDPHFSEAKRVWI